MTEISLTFDIDKVTANIERLQRDHPSAIVRALNRSIASGRTIMAREMSKDVGLKVGDVRDQMRIVEAAQDRLEAKLIASGKRIPLIAFKARGPEPTRGRGRGVSYKIGPQSKTLKDAFIATMGSGHRGVFRRVGSARKSRGAWSLNLPVVELKGPSLPKVFLKFRPIGLARAAEQLRKNLVSEFRFAMSRAT